MKRLNFFRLTTYLMIFALTLSFSIERTNSEKVTDAEAMEIVKTHNIYRAQVGVEDIEWSDEVAASAQAWADKLVKEGCNINHSHSEYGENIYWSSAEATAKQAVESWAHEKSLYKGEKITTSNYTTFGHYTQMVWRNTKFVGAGRARCANGSVFWVCQYSPPGNYIGQSPF